MKNYLLPILIIVLLALTASAQKKNKKQKSASPDLAVAKVEDAPLPPASLIPPAPPEKSANGSLFTESAPNGNLLNDFKARHLGDLVFVDVVETSTAVVSSGANRKRDSGTLGGVGTIAGALPIPGAAVAGTIVGALGQRKFEGAGSTTRKSDVRARIAARVIEVLPNGDLRIEALKQVKINKETEQLAVTGIVRTNDLKADNSVPTVLIGNLRVDFNGKGVASADNAPGWLFRLFEKVTPF